MTGACLECATRARLLAQLAGHIQNRADTDRHPLTGMLRLSQAELLEALGLPRPRIRDELKRARVQAAHDIEPRADGASVCHHDEENYPERLRDLGLELPHALFVTGTVSRLRELTDQEGRQVAIVGTRRPTSEGRFAAEEIGAALGVAGVPVISGMAFGIDAAAHTGACAAGGPVIAVLGSGADTPSPKTNTPLYKRIRQNGIVISEMPWGCTPRPWMFPARNRLMAALAYMTVVVEAADRSGSLITARFAEEIDRTIGVLPGSPQSHMSKGTNRLLRETPAAVVRGPADILDDLYGAGGADRLYQERRLPEDPASAAILKAVKSGAPLETVRARIGLTPRELRTRLARLEGDGWIRPVGLGGYAPVAGGATLESRLGLEEAET
jgi:DNA processing protein